MSYKNIHPLTVVMKGKISYIDQNMFLHQAVNIIFSAVKLGFLTWGVYGIDSLLQPASSGLSMNCSFSHFCVGFTRESGRLPLDIYLIFILLHVYPDILILYFSRMALPIERLRIAMQ